MMAALNVVSTYWEIVAGIVVGWRILGACA
jgi:hypothetical protein